MNEDEQLDLLAPAVKVRRDAASTSAAAAERHRPRSGTARHRVLHALATARDGATDEEVAAHLRMSPNTERPRRVELVEAGWVEATERTRPTVCGAAAVVWTVTPAGHRLLSELGPVPA
jgi:predicted ArsR family transcriptional regulator